MHEKLMDKTLSNFTVKDAIKLYFAYHFFLGVETALLPHVKKWTNKLKEARVNEELQKMASST